MNRLKFAHEFAYSFRFLQDEFSNSDVLIDKEKKALKLFKQLFANVNDGDDSSFRDILLYKTPYYFKGIVDDKTFFDTYWEGGFESYINGITVRNNK